MKKQIKCAECGKIFTVTNPRTNNIKYCSVSCRNKTYQPRVSEWGRRYRAKKAVEAEDRIKCLVCGRWYRQVGSHVIQVHGFESAREYREYFDLERKRGLTRGSYREKKAEKVFENLTVKNLDKGHRFWFKPGDKKAGRYQRSHITLERLRKLHLLNKKRVLAAGSYLPKCIVCGKYIKK